MRVCGIIAEYNPFHSGHAYQIAEARARSGGDYLIVVMSGDFVQRGAPALMDKYIRARMALASGADLVLMLPVAASTASAEGFARAGVSVLHTTGVVDTISFGCEDPAVCGEPYRELARILSTESPEFQAALQRGLSSGLPYAQARTAAIHSCTDGCDPGLLNNPNNLLAFEYMRAIAYTHSDLELCPIRRLGSYHGNDMAGGSSGSDDPADGLNGDVAVCPDDHDPGTAKQMRQFLSASACRRLLSGDPNAALHILREQKQLPESSLDLWRQYHDTYAFLSEQDLSAQVHYALLAQRDNGYSSYLDCGSDLSARIRKLLGAYEDFSGFCDLLKNKSLTRARIARALTHILLQLPAESPAPLINADGYVPYLRVLGFRSSAAGLLHEIKQHAAAPLVTRPSQLRELSQAAADSGAMQTAFAQDLFAADVYRSALLHKCGCCYADDYRRRIEIL